MADAIFLAKLLGTALFAAVAGLLMVAYMQPRRVSRPLLADGPQDAAFLFDGDVLVDATPGARALLSHGPLPDAPVWPRLMAWLTPRFPDIASEIAAVSDRGRMELASGPGVDPPLLLSAEHRGGLMRIVVSGPDSTPLSGADPMVQRALAEELAFQRTISALAPLPVWQTTPAGEVIWANGEYLRLAAARLAPGEELVWPLPTLFDGTAAGSSAPRRMRLPPAAGGGERWFDVSSVAADAGAGAGPFVLHHGVPADAAVQAEQSLKGFMQTLAKTFAHLPTGLAIFDQHRRLALYNPALVDLTGLPPDMLSARPALVTVLDKLRERNMLPEPRDYRSWRRRIADFEAAVAQDAYEETWALPGGQTYRMTARPHPNGALALMLDDISTEVGQARRYRADLELGQAVIDAMDEAIAVFSAAGTLVLSNTAYARLWGHDPGGSLDNDATFAALAAHWRERTAPSPVWDRAEGFAATPGPRMGWTDEARLSDGRLLSLRFERVAGGATLAGFRLAMPGSEGAIFTSVRHSA